MGANEGAYIKEIQNKYGFTFSKKLGQNFLKDSEVTEKIIEGMNITDEDTVLEIGPGAGVLTIEAARRAKRVIAVEIDKALVPVLKQRLREFENVRVINADILKTDLAELLCGERAKVVGNLPYYITTPIIMRLLEDNIDAESITVMMQKEVADRIMAPPGGKTCGAISVAVQYYCDIEKIADVKKTSFVPQPKVDSAVLKLSPKKKKPAVPKDEKLFFECVRAGFGMRRKTLLNSLAQVGGANKEIIGEALSACGIDQRRRAETLSIEEFVRICDMIGKRL